MKIAWSLNSIRKTKLLEIQHQPCGKVPCSTRESATSKELVHCQLITVKMKINRSLGNKTIHQLQERSEKATKLRTSGFRTRLRSRLVPPILRPKSAAQRASDSRTVCTPNKRRKMGVFVSFTREHPFCARMLKIERAHNTKVPW